MVIEIESTRHYCKVVEKQAPHKRVLEVRRNQISIMNFYSNANIIIPIHFALGHEALASAVSFAIRGSDKILLTHRNIHYHLAMGASPQSLIDEYLLKSTGLSRGRMGSMNLMNPKVGNIYTSNILGNNLAVSTGIAFSLRYSEATVWCVTGDGAMEEGAFYESLLLSSSKNLKIIFLIENNEWSLASSISERRSHIDLKKMSNALGLSYLALSSNNALEYTQDLEKTRDFVLESQRPAVVECFLTTLGGYHVMENGHPRFVNYHAGHIDQRGLADFKEVDDYLFTEDSSDPAWVSMGLLDQNTKNL
jgi:TPP-dependent pyruvate/acetoin dehydrogenase alpha subunit